MVRDLRGEAVKGRLGAPLVPWLTRSAGSQLPRCADRPDGAPGRPPTDRQLRDG